MESENIITLITSFGAILISGYSLWYTKFRKGKLQFICTRWTAIGAEVKDKDNQYIGATFALDVSVKNDGAKVRTLQDLMLVAIKENGQEILNSPLYSLTFCVCA